MKSFSLWDKPWIPATYCTGQSGLLSIRDILVQAHEVREISDSSPLITAAIPRLLQAVLYRIFMPRAHSDWVRLWDEHRFNPDKIDEYGDIYSEKFDLFHPEQPFYQVPLIEGEIVHPISALILEAASGNNATLFDHGLAEGDSWLPLDRAACHLVVHQAFAVGGGKSKPFYRMDGPLTKGLVIQAIGRTLWETLMLNLLPQSDWNSYVPTHDDDCPVWEREVFPEPCKDGTIPRGPLDYLTWQSRQIHLCADDTGRITGCQIMQRYALPRDGNRRDPYKPYVTTGKEGWQSFRPNKQRAVWQYTHLLLQSQKPKPNNNASDSGVPGLSSWLATLKLRDRRHELPAVIDYSASCLMLDPQKPAKIEQWRKELLAFPIEYFGNEKLVLDLNKMFSWTSRYERLLAQTALALAIALGEKSKQQNALTFLRTGSLDNELRKKYQKISNSFGLVGRFWPTLETPFRQLLKQLPEEGYEAAQEEWLTALNDAARRSYSDVRNSLVYEVSTFDILTQLDQVFYGRLAGIRNTIKGKEGKDSGSETIE
ncbi:MAG: type I-E CRISPR-associated protein Cse1/CasA [Lawsonibacter sp.]|jgi:CRISPR system Cascade subunit CasA